MAAGELKRVSLTLEINAVPVSLDRSLSALMSSGMSLDGKRSRIMITSAALIVSTLRPHSHTKPKFRTCFVFWFGKDLSSEMNYERGGEKIIKHFIFQALSVITTLSSQSLRWKKPLGSSLSLSLSFQSFQARSPSCTQADFNDFNDRPSPKLSPLLSRS